MPPNDIALDKLYVEVRNDEPVLVNHGDSGLYTLERPVDEGLATAISMSKSMLQLLDILVNGGWEVEKVDLPDPENPTSLTEGWLWRYDGSCGSTPICVTTLGDHDKFPTLPVWLVQKHDAIIHENVVPHFEAEALQDEIVRFLNDQDEPPLVREVIAAFETEHERDTIVNAMGLACNNGRIMFRTDKDSIATLQQPDITTNNCAVHSEWAVVTPETDTPDQED